jgi:hypothetical protein
MGKQIVLFTLLAVLVVLVALTVTVLVITLNNKTVIVQELPQPPLFPLLLAQRDHTPSIIYTCTTYFELPHKWRAFKKGIRSLLQHHPHIRSDVGKWYVVNEPAKKTDWAAKLHRKFPWIHFVQKPESARGQAASLNMILQEIKPYDLWLQWEESWFATRPFLHEAVQYLQDGKLNQLQLTVTPPQTEPNWWKLSVPVAGVSEWRAVPLSSAMREYVREVKTGYDLTGDTTHWPLFSLCPSLNTVEFNTQLPAFNTDAALWPWKFEYEYARNWALAGGKKGIFTKAPVTRDSAHKSTYG